MLAYAADSQGGTWTPEQARLALDLMGTPSEFREGVPPGTSIDDGGKLVGPADGPAVVARRAIDELNGRIETLRPIEEAARDRAEADLSDDDPELRRLRRYEAELHRRIKWAHGLLSEGANSPEPAPTPEGEAGPSAEPIPTRPSSKPAPPRQPSRAERRLVKAESRREAKRQKARPAPGLSLTGVSSGRRSCVARQDAGWQRSLTRPRSSKTRSISEDGEDWVSLRGGLFRRRRVIGGGLGSFEGRGRVSRPSVRLVVGDEPGTKPTG